MNYECILCQINGLKKRMDKFEISNEKRSTLVSQLMKDISSIDIENSYSPEITRNILNSLKNESAIDDPYFKEKDKSNMEMLSRYDEFRERIQNSEDKFDIALRLAIAGNIIDFGPTDKFDVSETIERVLNSDFEIDHSQQLRTEIDKAKTILFLGDNCGEIVLDKLFLETINHPNVYFAVRNKPILNDVTTKEALQIGIDKVAKIISNGDDAPSTLLHRVSTEFLEIYKSADLIISKGMGNYEGLMNETDSRIFFLLMIKCPVIGKIIGAKNGAFVVQKNNF